MSRPNQIIQSSDYRDTYEEIPVQRKFRKIKFDICQINYNDCIYVRNKNGEIEKHPRVSWDATIVSASRQASREFQAFYEQFKHDILDEWIDHKNGKLYLLWKDSYVSPRDITNIY